MNLFISTAKLPFAREGARDTQLSKRRMEDYIVNLIVIATICWTATFILIRSIFRDRPFHFSNRIVSTIHASVAVCLASLTVQDWSCPVCPLASQSSPWQVLFQSLLSCSSTIYYVFGLEVRLKVHVQDLQMKTLAVTLSYLIYDLICCLFDKKVNLDNSVHHIVSIIGIGAGLVYQKVRKNHNRTIKVDQFQFWFSIVGFDLQCGSEMVAALWITEISSPFLHMRELLKEIGYRDTVLNLVADVSSESLISSNHLCIEP